MSGTRGRSHLRLVPEDVPRPDLRRLRRRDVVVYRLRVDIDDASPPIWRRLDLRSDLTLDVVHQILQVAYDWTDSHLHRFSLGGGSFDHGSQLLLCPYDVDHGDRDERDEGLAAATIRLDETLGEPGHVLHYLYDYGDNWELTLRLEEVLPAGNGCPAAIVVDGERAAPPDDCGHLVDADSLAEILPDPALFELDRLNKGLGNAYFVLREAGVDVRLVELVHQLTYAPNGSDLTETALALVEPPPLDAVDMAANLQAYQWFLDRAEAGGIPLTAAGYLKPADVVEAAKIIPAMQDWIGQNNRETHCYPILRFREGMQSMGLLRKLKGRLLLTKAGEAARRDPDKLVEHMASRLIPNGGKTFEVQATVLMLAYAAAAPGGDLPVPKITAFLAELGWRYPSGGAPGESALYDLPAYDVLINVTDEPQTWMRRRSVSPAAAALARRALVAKL